MSHKTEAITHENPKRSLKQRARTAGALLTATAAIAGLGAPAAHAEDSGANKGATPSYLRNPHELPGLKTHLGRETLNKIKDSTVEIVWRPSVAFGGSPNAGWSPSCTAVKVSIPGQRDPFIMSAAHCFSSLTGVRSGAFTDTQAPYELAENFTANSPYDYAVVDPSVSYNNRLTQPVAIVNEISLSTDNKDVALLRVSAAHRGTKNPFGIRGYKDIPAIPLKVAEKAPLQGTPVALYGEPQANNFEPVSGTGVYLGRVSYNEAKTENWGPEQPAVYRQMDLVGINPSASNEDNCNYGASGSMALLPNGSLLGNLTLRTSNGYGVDKKVQLPDNIDFDNYWRPIWEEQLGVQLSDFGVICGYTVMNAQTPGQLVEGFNHPVPAFGK